MNKNLLTVFFLSLIVAVSGCVDDAEDILDDVTANGDSSSETEPETPEPESGLEIAQFEVLNPEIPARDDAVGTTIELTLENYHSEPVNISEIDIYDSGLLEIENMSCDPSDIEGAELEPAREDYAPQILCEWDVYPPDTDDFGDFDQRTFSPRLHLEYESILENSDPIQVSFEDRDDIREMAPTEGDFTNSEVSMTKNVEQNPVPVSDDAETTRSIEYELTNDGSGTLGEMDSEEQFEIEFDPEDTFHGEDCEDGGHEVSIDIGDTAEFSCELGFDEEVTRNLFTSVRYKYIKEPTVDITVVS